ncbi:response regulator [Phenylobacterium sp.]|jgi:CheY-like chemotaxis protein|uniref:response regulator n=1 Tax=Phenylobacterium sp. TaxID=1871053 RepID=UPI002E2F201A|nr:response regulator [Phenylobacterium sp.]HEX4710231.1 response regulator [Phenylobacterium sp.]
MQRLRVLLVEDDFVINVDICGVLEDLGIFVTSVHTADEAISAIDSSGCFKALLTDIDLGAGLNGFDVARHARGLYPKLPVVFVSGTLGSRHAAEGVEGSVLVAKPFHPLQIREALDRAVGLEAA